MGASRLNLVHFTLIRSFIDLLIGQTYMRIHYIATLGFIGLLAVLAVDRRWRAELHRLCCSRMTAEEQTEVRQSFGIPADVPMRDLGVVGFRPGIPKRVRVGVGKYCTITATVLTNGLVRMNFLYESKGEVIEGAKTQSHCERSQLVFRPPIKGWLCLRQMDPHLVVAMQPTIIP